MLAKGWTHGINFEMLEEQSLSFEGSRDTVKKAERSASAQPAKGSSRCCVRILQRNRYLAGRWWEHWTSAFDVGNLSDLMA